MLAQKPALLSLFILFACFISTWAAEHSSLVVGMELSYPPFEMIDPEGNPAGISVEIAEALGRYLNKPVVIENIPFVGLIPALKSGKIDLIISSLSITPQRLESIDFSIPYLSIGLCLLVNKKSTIENIEDANQKGKTIVVKAGTNGESYAREHLQRATIIVLDKEATCVLEVAQGKSDAFIYDQLSVYTNWKKNPNTTRALLKPFQKQSWAIGIRKGNPIFLKQVDAFIQEFRDQGGIKKLTNKYLNDQLKAFKEMGIPLVF